MADAARGSDTSGCCGTFRAGHCEGAVGLLLPGEYYTEALNVKEGLHWAGAAAAAPVAEPGGAEERGVGGRHCLEREGHASRVVLRAQWIPGA